MVSSRLGINVVIDLNVGLGNQVASLQSKAVTLL